MQKYLEEIASITTGVYEKGNPTGDTIYLQGKHFDEYGIIRDDVVIGPELQADDRLGKHLLKNGDVLLVAKGESNRACLYQQSIGQAVASSTFFVIRLTSQELLPEFLQWYFNTSYMQDLFSGLSKGTQISSLSKKALAEVKIPVPSLEKQRSTLKIQQLWHTEQTLTKELLSYKDAFYQQLLLRTIS